MGEIDVVAIGYNVGNGCVFLVKMNNVISCLAGNNYHVLITGVSKVRTSDAGRLVDDLRRVSPKDVLVQMVDSGIVYGTEHVQRVLEIVFELQNRKIMIANRLETELLMRLTCTSQFSVALKRGGIKNSSDACLVIFSKMSGSNDLLGLLNSFEDKFGFRANLSVLKPSDAKRKRIAGYLEIPEPNTFGERFLDYVVERAAIMH